MAAKNKKLELKENADGILGVIISREEYREYCELLAKRDRSIESMRARMKANSQNARNLAGMIVKGFERVGFDDLSLLLGESAGVIYELATEILETE